MRSGAIVAAMTILLSAAPAQAFDAGGADIIGLRLGMPETEVVTTLRRQGFAVSRDHGALIARTRDGQLTVELAGDQSANEIRYVFTGRGAGEREKIRASIIDRFGEPDQAKPMTWCLAVERNGLCPADQASLTFLPETLTSILKAGKPQQP